MRHDEFAIGREFWCADRRWRCTDLGTRVIVAISLEARQVVTSVVDPSQGQARIETRSISEDPSWLNGPPYAVEECVFDEYSIGGCSPLPPGDG